MGSIMKYIIVCGCVFILLFMVTPVMAEESWQITDGKATKEGRGSAGNVANENIEGWNNMGPIHKLSSSGGKTVATFSGGAWIESSYGPRTGILLTAFRDRLPVWVHWISSNRYDSAYIAW